jgi:hypothetical protein
MVGAGQHLGDHHAPKPALDGLDFLEALDFEPDVREHGRRLLGRKAGVDIAFEPVIGDIHGKSELNYR